MNASAAIPNGRPAAIPQPSRQTAHRETIRAQEMATATREGNGPAGPATKDQDQPKDPSAMTALQDVLPILPKGLVENTSEIYAEVASYQVVPPEKLREYWHVYTTTHRKLYDPTASRLESFWWHVWGSDRRHLHGKTLAKLYESISNGPTFVPLRGPPNRFEKPMVSLPPPADFLLEFELKKKEAASRKVAGPPAQIGSGESGSGRRNPDDQAKAEKAAGNHQGTHLKKISSSSARPPPHQSILKKPKVSMGGPRHTPRFALPTSRPLEEGTVHHPPPPIEEVEGEGDSASGTPESASGGLKSPTGARTGEAKHDARKMKAKPVKKKFVAGGLTSAKRKIVVAKRNSSHSSTGSGSEAVGPRDPLKVVPHAGQILIREEEMGDRVSTSSTSSKRDSDASPKKRSKSAKGKQPMLVTQPAATTATDTRATRVLGQPEDLVASPTEIASPPEKQRSPVREADSGFVPKAAAASASPASTILEASKTAAVVSAASAANTASASQAPRAAEVHSAIPLGMCRSFSQDSYGSLYRRNGTLRSMLPLGLGPRATAAPSTSMVAASGIFLEMEGPDPVELYAQTGLDDEDVAVSQRPLFTPTRPVQTPRIPFARTRSQLNIILDREKERKERKERQSETSFASWCHSCKGDRWRKDDQQVGR